MARQRKDTTMVLDTQVTANGLPTAEDAEDASSETAKRERVDLETLDPNTRVTLAISMPAGMKLAAIKAGEADGGLAGTAWARKVLAERLEYSVPAEFSERTRAHKYATPEDAKAAAKDRAKENRELLKAAMAALKAGKISRDDLGLN